MILDLVYYPDERLTTPCKEVEEFDENLKLLVQSLVDTMQHYSAHGIAANQAGSDLCVFLAMVNDSPKVFVNPKITGKEGTIRSKEGCLSFPGVIDVVDRFEEITIEAQDVSGEPFTLVLDGFDAVATQHEYDHLNGITFLSKMKPLQKRMALKKLRKTKKKYGL